MTRDPASRDDARELRLEGWVLALVGGVFVALLIGSFQLGRAVERSRGGSAAAAAAGDASGAAAEREPDEAGENLTFFDTLSAPGQQAEPQREAASASPRPGATAPPASSPAGPWFVQVFVGRDRAAAEEVVRTLRGKGYPVRTEAVREGASTSLFKVRVGGFPTREAADAAVERLNRDGQASTWVVRTGA